MILPKMDNWRSQEIVKKNKEMEKKKLSNLDTVKKTFSKLNKSRKLD